MDPLGQQLCPGPPGGVVEDVIFEQIVYSVWCMVCIGGGDVPFLLSVFDFRSLSSPCVMREQNGTVIKQ